MKKDAIIAALAFGGLKPVPTVDAQVVQSTGTSAAAVMSQKATTDALNQKQNAADPAGLADNLTPYSADSGATQSVPFINQGTGCGNGESVVDTGSYSQVKKKLGNSASVNQLSNFTVLAGSYSWGTAWNIPQMYAGNIWLFFTDANEIDLRIRNIDLGIVSGAAKYLLYNCPTSDTHYMVQFSGTATKDTPFRAINLTLWHGSTDRIPAHLLSHPEDFGRYYSGSLAYNPGQLVNADGSVLTSIGRNRFDMSQTMVSAIVGTDGSYTANANAKSIWMPCIPNTEYHFFKSKGARFNAGSAPTQITSGNFSAYGTSTSNNSFTITTGASDRYILVWFYNSAIDTGLTAEEVAATVCVSLYYPGESGYDQYYPYSVLAQIDTGSETLRSAGAVADEKTPDGTITRRVGVVDLGTLTWITWDRGRVYSTELSSLIKLTGAGSLANIIAEKYQARTASNIAGDETLIGIGINNTNVVVRTGDGNNPTGYLYYELATPTTEQGTPFSGASADNFAIDDFGSMYWTQSAGVPQGVEIFYPYDYKAAVDTILNEVNGDVTKLVTSEKVPDAPSSNGTYVLKVTISGGTPTYSWVADE